MAQDSQDSSGSNAAGTISIINSIGSNIASLLPSVFGFFGNNKKLDNQLGEDTLQKDIKIEQTKDDTLLKIEQIKAAELEAANASKRQTTYVIGGVSILALFGFLWWLVSSKKTATL